MLKYHLEDDGIMAITDKKKAKSLKERSLPVCIVVTILMIFTDKIKKRF